MDYVCDTNVWYDIAASRLDPMKLKHNGNRLLASPINAIEISTKLCQRSHVRRKQTAQAVLDHADGYLDDHEYHLAQIWKLSPTPHGLNWKDVYSVIARSRNLADIETGRSGFIAFSPVLAAKWRSNFTTNFVNQIVDSIRHLSPKYARAKKKGKMNYISDPSIITDLTKVLNDSSRVINRVLATRTRLELNMPIVCAAATPAEIVDATAQLKPFMDAYSAFILHAATVQSVKPNDWGDLHNFIYLQGNSVLLTSDKKWLGIANKANLSKLVKDPKTI